MIKKSIKKLVEGENLSYDDGCIVMKEIISGGATDAQISAILTALRMKGETPSEISAFASVMRKFCKQINPRVRGRLVDTCGTGGDSLKTFNISTISAIVASGAGVNIAKHGNRSFTSKCGSADVLESLGVNLYLEPQEVEASIEKIGIGFIYAPYFHPAMKYAVEPRRQLGIRTVFNLLGPLTNPASAKAQLLGVYDHNLTRPIAESLNILGCEEAMVVHGMGGMDEISTLGETMISWLKEGEVHCQRFSPSDFGFKTTTHEKIKSLDIRQGAEIFYRVLNGLDNGPRKDIVLANSMAGIIVSGKTDDIGHSIELAKESIESGAAYCKLKELVKQTGGDPMRLEELEEKYV